MDGSSLAREIERGMIGAGIVILAVGIAIGTIAVWIIKHLSIAIHWK